MYVHCVVTIATCVCPPSQLYDERVVCVELEALLQSSTEDHDQQDAQFHTEHEEEVRVS